MSERELAGDGPDTALARLLHATQRVRLDVLRTHLEQARASGAGLGVLSEAELAPHLGRLSRPVGALAPGEVVAERYRVEEPDKGAWARSIARSRRRRAGP